MTRLLCILVLIPACFAAPSNIIRPCQRGDYDCISKNLAGNSKCNPNVRGTIPSTYTISSFYFDAEYFNSSYIDTNLTISNHNNCWVSDFFFNILNDNCLLSIRCPGLEFNSTRTLIQHFAEGEDMIYNFDYSGVYPEVIVTVNLRPANAIDLCTAPAFAYVSALPDFKINPRDEATGQFLSSDLSYLNIYERETFADRANELIRYFINSILCNFGCDF